MPGPFISRDFEHFVQLEAVYNTSPGALVGADAFKCHTGAMLTRVKARRDRDQDKDNDASVRTTQGGREHSTWKEDGDIIPSGNAATPSEPDMDPFFEAHLGTKHKATAHTTLAAGSTTTLLNFTPGGVVASGTQVGDIIVVDVSAAFGLEARQVVSIATDAVTVDRALSAAPAAARAVYVGTTYRLSNTLMKTLHLWEYLNGNNFRHKAGGAIPRMMSLTCDFTPDVPVGSCEFSGEGAAIATHATSRPTPVTAGLPLVPSEGRVWIGATKQCLTKAELKSDNGVELRNNESCGLTPTGVKRTGNNGRYNITSALGIILLTDGVIDGYYDNAAALTAYDVLVQLGLSVGSICVWRTPKFIPDVPIGDVSGEVSLELSGKVYATSGDDEVTVAFI